MKMDEEDKYVIALGQVVSIIIYLILELYTELYDQKLTWTFDLSRHIQIDRTCRKPAFCPKSSRVGQRLARKLVKNQCFQTGF